MRLSVIVPARNEQDCVEDCLRSLVAQSEDGWRLGEQWEILLVDDHSTDRTREIAKSVAGVTVMDAPKLERGWTGKVNAVWAGAQVARGNWLLFTDADTVHEANSASRAVVEAERHEAALLSYSSRQIVRGFWQHALMPLVFSELVMTYPPAKVADPSSRIAAANGQFLLVRRDVYFAVGGHAAVRDSVLEDVELARAVKRSRHGVRLRYAPEAVSTRMYRSFGAMIEGWTKNLALLFGNPLTLAAWRALDFVLLFGLPLLAIWASEVSTQRIYWILVVLIWLRTLWRFYRRVAKSHFSALDCALTPLALPLFVMLLYQSWFHHTVTKRVSWKGREYASPSR